MKEYPIIDWPFTKADCYWTKKPCSCKGIQVHSVGCKGTLAARWEKSWNRPGRLTCGGYIIDLNGIYRVLQEGHKCWLSSSGPKGNANNDYLGFEICEPAKKDDTPEAAANLMNRKGNNPLYTLGQHQNHQSQTRHLSLRLFLLPIREYTLSSFQSSISFYP